MPHSGWPVAWGHFSKPQKREAEWAEETQIRVWAPEICGTGYQTGRNHRRVPEVQGLTSGPWPNPEQPLSGARPDRSCRGGLLSCWGHNAVPTQPEWGDLGKHPEILPESLEAQARPVWTSGQAVPRHRPRPRGKAVGMSSGAQRAASEQAERWVLQDRPSCSKVVKGV